MQGRKFFETFSSDFLSSVEDNSLDISIDSTVENIYTERKKKKEESFSQLETVEQFDILSSVSSDFTSVSPKKRALKFLGLKEKIRSPKLTDSLQNEKTLLAETVHDVYSFDKAQNVLQSLKLSDILEKGSIIEESKKTHFPTDGDIKISIDAWKRDLQKKLRKQQKVKKYEQKFYCLKQIVWNNLHNSYDHSLIKICNIYHDNTLECLFDDLSTLQFFGKNNLCIYRSADYMYSDINDHLFSSEKKDSKKKIEFNINDDIYEYLYTRKNELNQFSASIKKDILERNDIPKDEKKIYDNIADKVQSPPNTQSNANRNQTESVKGKEEVGKIEADIPFIQFCINKYPFFLKDKMKVVTHLYNLFSIEPYINHEYIEKDMYFSNSVKTVYSIEKTVHVTWKLYDKNTLKRLLKNILIMRRKKNVFRGTFIKIDNHISVNFLTQEIKIRDVNTNEEFKDNNYILLHGNGLCFSPHYHLLVPLYRHVQKQKAETNNHIDFLKSEKNDRNKTYEKEKKEQGNSFTLCYEYLYISQIFNIYDNFHIAFFYPLWVSYFFYYHLFVKEKIRKEENDKDENEEEMGLSFLSRGKQSSQSTNYHRFFSEQNEKETTKKEYRNDEDISYLIQLENLHAILNLCFETIMNKRKECYKTNKNNTIEFALPSSCFQQSENIEFVSEQTKININILYSICISKYNNVYCKNNVNQYIGDLLSTWAKETDWKSKQLCFNEIEETCSIRSLFPLSLENYFNSCKRIDNIIKVSIRCDGVCFFYIKDFQQCLFYSFFIIFNSLKNMLILSSNENSETKKRKAHSNCNSSNNDKNHKNKYRNNNETEQIDESNLSAQKTNVLLQKPLFQGEDEKLKNERNKETDKDHSISYSNSNNNHNNYYNNELIYRNLSFVSNEQERLLTFFFYAMNKNLGSVVLTNTEMQKRMKIKKESSNQYAYMGQIFEINNMKSVYNDFYICENRKMNTFKLINLIDRKKRKLLVPYYFDKKELTEFFFLKLSNVHVYDINRHLNRLYSFIYYNNSIFTPFLKEPGTHTPTGNVELDSLENIYTVNNELYFLYIKKINYCPDIYKYTYLYVHTYLMKNYFLYNHIYFDINPNLLKNEYCKLKYTNRNKQTISIHFTISFSYTYDITNKTFRIQPEYYITHIEKKQGECFDKQNYILFIENYLKVKETT